MHAAVGIRSERSAAEGVGFGYNSRLVSSPSDDGAVLRSPMIDSLHCSVSARRLCSRVAAHRKRGGSDGGWEQRGENH